ncbi:hypothetical protein OG243_11355 [Streptomyces sp. NBC_01318]|nr:hypothetical protein OG243_11355 [Streptomyces sp. NBC_01318]
MDEIGGVEVVAFADGEAFDGWLAAHHARHDGVWVNEAPPLTWTA